MVNERSNGRISGKIAVLIAIVGGGLALAGWGASRGNTVYDFTDRTREQNLLDQAMNDAHRSCQKVITRLQSYSTKVLVNPVQVTDLSSHQLEVTGDYSELAADVNYIVNNTPFGREQSNLIPEVYQALGECHASLSFAKTAQVSFGLEARLGRLNDQGR